jgi:hypothetical protein
MFRAIAAVISGYVVMAIIVFTSFTAAYLAMGAERAFKPGSYEVTPQWLAVWFIVSLLAAVVGGWLCTWIAKRARPAKAFAGIVLVLGMISAVFEMQKPDSQLAVRDGSVANADAMMNARQPIWVAWLTPLVGASGILLGARLCGTRTSVAEPPRKAMT